MFTVRKSEFNCRFKWILEKNGHYYQSFVYKREADKACKYYNSKKQLYSDEELSEAHMIVRNKILEVCKSLSGKKLNLISYMLSPRSTAIGASPTYNEGTIKNYIYNNLMCRRGLEFDGNEGYTLLELAKMIKEGCFD